MKYYDIVTAGSCDLNALSRYMIRGSAAEGIAMIEFQEKDFGDIRAKFAPENLAQFYREDRALCIRRRISCHFFENYCFQKTDSYCFLT